MAYVSADGTLKSGKPRSMNPFQWMWNFLNAIFWFFSCMFEGPKPITVAGGQVVKKGKPGYYATRPDGKPLGGTGSNSGVGSNVKGVGDLRPDPKGCGSGGGGG